MITIFAKGAIAVAIASVVVLSMGGCSGGQELTFFDHAQGKKDILPEGVKASGIEGKSSRFLGQDQAGSDYFVVRSSAEDSSTKMVCLVVVDPKGLWSRGCTGTLPVAVAIGSTTQATLFPEPLSEDQSKSGERVGDYIRVEPLAP